MSKEKMLHYETLIKNLQKEYDEMVRECQDKEDMEKEKESPVSLERYIKQLRTIESYLRDCISKFVSGDSEKIRAAYINLGIILQFINQRIKDYEYIKEHENENDNDE